MAYYAFFYAGSESSLFNDSLEASILDSKSFWDFNLAATPLNFALTSLGISMIRGFFFAFTFGFITLIFTYITYKDTYFFLFIKTS